jgi:hypothetical protein
MLSTHEYTGRHAPTHTHLHFLNQNIVKTLNQTLKNIELKLFKTSDNFCFVLWKEWEICNNQGEKTLLMDKINSDFSFTALKEKVLFK